MSLQPTFIGHVDTTQDALILFQAVIDGKLPTVSRRPQDRERNELVKSGSIFIFNEHSSGIKRWTDGIAWSPSRILGNFLVYRQLEKPFHPGEKKQTNKKKRRKPSLSTTPYDRSSSSSSTTTTTSSNNHNSLSASLINQQIPHSNSNIQPGSVTGSSLPIQIDLPNNPASSLNLNNERSLVGSLVDSYGFKKDGLIKKTISIVLNGEHHHLVSYYKPEDVLAGHFEQPSKCSRLKDIIICQDLITRQHFRVPIEPSQSSSQNVSMSSMGLTIPFGPTDPLSYTQQPTQLHPHNPSSNSNIISTTNTSNPNNSTNSSSAAANSTYNPYVTHVANYSDIPYDIDGFHQTPFKQDNLYYQNQQIPQSPIDTNNSNYYYNNYYSIRNPSEMMPPYTATQSSTTANPSSSSSSASSAPSSTIQPQTPANQAFQHIQSHPSTISITSSTTPSSSSSLTTLSTPSLQQQQQPTYSYQPYMSSNSTSAAAAAAAAAASTATSSTTPSSSQTPSNPIANNALMADYSSDPRRLPDMTPSASVNNVGSPLQQRPNINMNYGFGTYANASW